MLIKIVNFYKHLFSSLVYNCSVLFLTLLSYFLGPLILFLSIPLFLYRFLIFKTAKCWRPSFGKMVTSRSSIFACDAIYSRPKNTVVGRFNLDGKLELEKFKELLKEKLLSAKRGDELIYPEFKQCLTQWAGFFFWEDVKNFDINYHVQEIQLPLEKVPRTEVGLRQIHKDLLLSPWKEGTPLWKVLLVDISEDGNANKGSKKTVVFVAIHHALADGYSLLKCFYGNLLGIEPSGNENAKPAYKQRNILKLLKFYLKFPFVFPYEIAKALIYPLKPFVQLPFYKEASNGYANKKMPILDQTSMLDIRKIKEIKDHFKVTFTSVLFSALAGALRELMTEKKNLNIPETFPCIVPFPTPGHPDKLRNYMGVAVSNFPTAEADPLKRLILCDNDHLRLKSSTFPLSSFISFMIIGCYPVQLMRILVRNCFSSVWLTSFPGGVDQFSLGGRKVNDLSVGVGLLKGSNGIGFCALSYQNQMVVTVTADSSVLTEDELRGLCQGIEGQIDILHSKIIRQV